MENEGTMNMVAGVFDFKDRDEGDGSCFKMQVKLNYRVVFLTGPPLKMSLDWPPPKLLGLAPPKFSLCCNQTHYARHLVVFRSQGGPVWDS